MAQTGVTSDEFLAVPSGYTPALLMSDSTMALMCDTCGANVSRRNADLHSGWHQRLWERLGPI